MRAVEVNRLRGEIARLLDEGLGADEIAARLGCARSTVFKVRRAPETDGRCERVGAGVQREMVRLGAGGARGVGEVLTGLRALRRRGQLDGAVPSRATVARWLRRLELAGEDEGGGPDPYADLGLADYGLARRSNMAATGPEIGLLRALLRHAVRELAEADPETRRWDRLRAQVGLLIDVLTRARRGRVEAVARSRLLELLGGLCDEVGEEVLG